MPTRPAPFCRGNNRRCPNKAVHNGLCQQHHDEREREYDARRGNAAERGYDEEWRQTRDQYLAQHPYCECDDCLKQPIWARPAAVDVDHKDGLGPKGPRGHDPDNLRAMSHGHHSRRTARDQPGGWAKRAVRRRGLPNDEDEDPWTLPRP